MSSEKRSPIKSPPPRVAGQSLDEEIGRTLDEEVAPWISVAVMSIFIAVIEWIRWFFDFSPKPELFTLAALMAIYWCFRKSKHWKIRMHALRLGREGEREVGAVIDGLRAHGCCVIHDLIADNFNIDHVVICDRGIFVIETKCVSKPIEGKPKVHYNGSSIVIDGVGDYSFALSQVMAEAHWLGKICEELSGVRCVVRSIVVFPGWFVEQEKSYYGVEKPWVLNPKGIETFIGNSPTVLTSLQVRAIEGQLRQFIKNRANISKEG